MSKHAIESSWKEIIGSELNEPYMKNLFDFLDHEHKLGKTIYPEEENWFSALNETPLEKVKVVILGQDPYHGPNQAHGLAFSVKKGIKPPPSLVNIFKELHADTGCPIPNHGHLISWAKQGVLLLNTVLTVEASKAGSHHGRGWEKFTDKIIEKLNEKENIVFILWGSPAQKKAKSVDHKKHLIIESVHPSPLSSYRGFFGSKPFSKANEYLKKNGIKEIDWKIT